MRKYLQEEEPSNFREYAICAIPKNVYDQISDLSSNIEMSIHIKHFNPLQNKDYDITYDAGREEVYEAENSLTK